MVATGMVAAGGEVRPRRIYSAAEGGRGKRLDEEMAMLMFKKKLEMPSAATALPGRNEPIATASHHFVNGRPLKGPYPEGVDTAIFGLGCFWGAERKFWEL